MNIIRQRILETVTKQPTTIGDLSKQFQLPSEYIRTQLYRLVEEGQNICIEHERVYVAKDGFADYLLMATFPVSIVSAFWWAL